MKKYHGNTVEYWKQNTTENLELFNKAGKKVYDFYKRSDGFSHEYTYDSYGNVLTFKGSNGVSCEYTRDSNGNILTYKNSDGFSYEYTYDSNGNTLTYKSSNGYSSEYTYDSRGNILTYKDSNGFTQGFDVPEYTMEELVEKLGNFKIKK
jgi:YD repeat-containing protein